MQLYELKKFSDIESIKIKKGDKFIISFENTSIKEKSKILSFFSGLTFLEGTLKKQDKNNFLIEVW